MRGALRATLLALAVTLVSADYLYEHLDVSPRAFSRRSRYAVNMCESCGPNQCHVMGMQRYAEPFCDLKGGLGSPCRMWQEPENKTLHFPNSILKCNNVYMQYCPCAEGLVCEDMECKLANQSDNNIGLEDEEELAGAYDPNNPDNVEPQSGRPAASPRLAAAHSQSGAIPFRSSRTLMPWTRLHPIG